MKPVFLVSILSLLSHQSLAAGALSMDAYLDQVKKSNDTYQGSAQYRDGAVSKSAEADLVTAYKLTANAQYKSDKSAAGTPGASYDSSNTAAYSVGVQKTTTFGLDAKLSYDVVSSQYKGVDAASAGFMEDTTTATPAVTLTQSLWQNAQGHQTQNTIEQKTAQAEADRYNYQANMDTVLQNAIAAYWKLVLSREIVITRRVAVENALSIHDYNRQRARMNLGEQADVYTANASLEARRLDLQSAEDDEAAALRVFNQYRNHPAGENPGQLATINWNFLKNLKLPERTSDRSDIKSAKAQATANAATARLQAEGNQPVLNAFVSYGLNGRSRDWGDALSDSYSANRPTSVVGVSLSIPLDHESQQKAREGALAQASASEVLYQQKFRDQEADWADIVAKLTANQKRVILAEKIEEAQKTKLNFERKRLKEGRSSTYQVLQYEQDYTAARLSRIQTASEMINLLSRSMLYNSSSEGIIK